MANENLTQQNSSSDFSAPDSQSGLVSDSLFEVIWRHRWVVLICVIAALAAGFIYILNATPIFTSTSRIYVEQSGPKIIEDSQGIMTQSKNYLYTQAELLKSTPIVAAAMDQTGIRQLRSFTEIDNPVAYLKKMLDVQVGKKDDILSVAFDSPYPAEAAQVVNTIVDAYITYNATQKKSSAGEVLKILQTQKDKAVSELDKKREQMLAYQKENPSLTFQTSQGNIIIERLGKLSEALTTAELKTVEAHSAYEAVKQFMNDPEKLRKFVEAQRARSLYVYGSSEISRLQTEKQELELQFADARKQLTADHPAVAALADKIEDIRSRMVEVDKQYADSLLAVANQDYLSAQESEKQIRDYFEKQRQEALSLNEKVLQYQIFQTDAQRAEDLIAILDDRIKQINVTEDTGALNISILETAALADKPSKPQKARILAMALVIGLMLGGGLSLVRDWLDTRLRSADEISAILGVPVLGTVPHMSQKESVTQRGRKVLLDSASGISEAYRTIRTSVFFGAPDGQAKTLLVTSPAPGDGKSTLVSNLALTMAQAEQNTLIIDADIRKARQHEIFTLSDKSGLTSVLAGQQTLESCLCKTKVENLHVLPAGPEVPNPSEMLNSAAFNKLMQELKGRYDRIIIDSPPVMPVTDARILGALCDKTVLVLRAEKSTRKASQQARDGLLAVGSSLLGVVVNDITSTHSRYGYYSGYGYGKYYGRKSQPQPQTT